LTDQIAVAKRANLDKPVTLVTLATHIRYEPTDGGRAGSTASSFNKHLRVAPAGTGYARTSDYSIVTQDYLLVTHKSNSPLMLCL
jgi:hypothetical protein